jgi:hypothetical protein
MNVPINNNIVNLSLSIVSHSHFIKEITGFNTNNLDVVLQQIHIKYTTNERNQYIINKYNNKLYKPTIGMPFALQNIEGLNCISDKNIETGSCKYSFTRYGIHVNKDGLLNINTQDDIVRCNFPQNKLPETENLIGGKKYYLTN